MPWSRDTAESYGELGAQGHVAIFDRLLRDVAGSLEGLRALDFGCGPGRVSASLLRLGAGELVGLDESETMIAEAREILAGFARGEARLRLEVGDERALPLLGRFDFVLSSLVLMMCATRERLELVARRLVEALDDEGRLLVIVTHPCFRHADYRTFRYELPEDYDYWSAGQPYEVVLTPPGADDDAEITDYHWRLADYVNALTKAGGQVVGVRELAARYDERGGPLGPPAYLALLVEGS